MDAWGCVSEELVKKSWIVAGYRTSGELGREVNSSALVHYSKEDLGSIVENIAGNAGRMMWMYHGNGNEDPFPDEDNNVDWDLDEVERATRPREEQWLPG